MTVLCGTKPVLGVKVSVFPPLDQVPATAGVSVGNGELAESGSEKLKTIAAFPLMPVDPFVGASEVTLKSCGRTACTAGRTCLRGGRRARARAVVLLDDTCGDYADGPSDQENRDHSQRG